MLPHDPTWAGRRATDALNRVRADGARHHKPCCICDGPIDYTLRAPHPQACSVQHLKARSLHPELTWEPGNWAPAHLRCNQQAGTGSPKPAPAPLDVGPTSGW